MNILKTPQQKLMEEAGMTPASPGMLKTPQQLLLEEAGVTPPASFADGGQVQPQISPEMLRALIQAYQQYFNVPTQTPSMGAQPMQPEMPGPMQPEMSATMQPVNQMPTAGLDSLNIPSPLQSAISQKIKP